MVRPDADRTAGGLPELGRRYDLTAAAMAAVRCLAELVTADPLAPTGVRDHLGVIEEHLADSLVALDLPPLRERPGRVVDIGSGAGFPGLPLAAALAESEFVLLEASGRKCGFVNRAVMACGLANASVVHARAEAWPDGREAFDLATARAVAPLAVVLEYAAPLLRPGGTLISWRGRRDPAAEGRAAAAAAELGMELEVPVLVKPFPRAVHRHLHVATKIAPTPPRFPRRPGVAARRPLGGR